jgi:Family of unknown function (DUF5519)
MDGTAMRTRVSPREESERKLADIPNPARRRPRLGNAHAFLGGEREIAHFHSDGRMDVRFTCQRIRELKMEGALGPRVRARGPSADWAAVSLQAGRDAPLAVELVEDAMRTNV